LQKEKAAREKDNAKGWPRCFCASDLEVEWQNSPGLRHWKAIKHLTSLVVQVFVRNITRDHSPKDASKLLFAHHKYGAGSGDLGDYLDGRLPPPRKGEIR
jgi:hypothetical protein